MARFQQRANGAWTATIRRVGWPDCSQTFPLKGDAQIWARATERAMDLGGFVPGDLADKTRFELIAHRYLNEVLPTMRGRVQGEYLINRLLEVFGKYKLSSITPTMLSKYRDDRLAVVSGQTVVHELGMISRILKAAQLDWGIVLPGGHPVSQVRKPKVEAGRTRRLEQGEEALLLRSLDECDSKWIKPAFQIAIATAARQSEILSMCWEDVDLDRRVVRLRGPDGGVTKSGEAYRDVPLTPKVVDVLKDLPRPASGRGRVLELTQSALLQAWPRAVDRARKNHLLDSLCRILQADHGMTDAEAQAQVKRLFYKRTQPLVITEKEWKFLEKRNARPADGKAEQRKWKDMLLGQLQTILTGMHGLSEAEAKIQIRRLVFKSSPALAVTVNEWDRLQAEDKTLTDLRFHDLRHEATSRLAEKLQMHELMKVTGHKTSAMLSRYYHPRAEDLALKLG